MQEEVQRLLSERRFDPSITPQLEAYVDEQIKGGYTDLDANLALLRFYQYNPATANSEVICKILVKALMQMPGTDFMLCMYLVPGAAKDQKIEILKQLSDKLETCQFKEYWADMADDKNASVVNGIPGFHEAIRKYIVGVISATYQVIAKDELEILLNLKGAQLDQLLEERKWVAKGSDVQIPVNEFNEASVKFKQDGISFDQLAPIIVSTAGL
eukprot:767435-Hanusia_phi.AAC.4